MKQYPVHTFNGKNGETIAYRKAGENGPHLVLVHGNMSSSVHWQTTMEQLEDSFQIIAMDLRGFGDSTYQYPVNSLSDFADDVIELVASYNIDSFMIVGWSTGGGIALEVAAQLKSSVTKVVLLDSVGLMGYPMFKKDEKGQPILTEIITTKEEIANDPVQVLPILMAYQNKDKGFMRMIWDALIYNLNKPSESDYELYLDAMLKQRNLVDVDYGLITFNITEDYNGVVMGNNRIKDITAQVIIFHGEKDLVVPIQYAYDAKERFGHQAELVVFENAGHSIITDDLPLFIKTLKEKLV